jgi:hypothetical protein
LTSRGYCTRRSQSLQEGVSPAFTAISHRIHDVARHRRAGSPRRVRGEPALGVFGGIGTGPDSSCRSGSAGREDAAVELIPANSPPRSPAPPVGYQSAPSPSWRCEAAAPFRRLPYRAGALTPARAGSPRRKHSAKSRIDIESSTAPSNRCLALNPNRDRVGA